MRSCSRIWVALVLITFASALSGEILKFRNSTMFEAQAKCNLVNKIGQSEGGWLTCLDRKLTKESVVYSFGLGNDPSFDLTLIKLFNAEVHAFDPTPTGERCFSNYRNKPSKWIYHPWGIHSEDGNITFAVPRRGVQYNAIKAFPGGNRQPTIVRTGYRLSTIMQKLGHSRLDICKFDVEGSEWSILDDIRTNKPALDQLFIEFHFFPVDIMDNYSEKVTDYILQLNSIGYWWFARKGLRVKAFGKGGVSVGFIEYSFIKV